MDIGRYRFLLPGLAVLAVDQASKAASAAYLQLFQRVGIFGERSLAFSRVHNEGLAFDQFSSYPPGYIEPYTLYGPALLLVGLIFFALIRSGEERGFWERAFFGVLIFSGFSNLVDHWRDRYVIDTFQLYIGANQWLPFNVADAGICMSAALLLTGLGREVLKLRRG